MNKTSKFNMGVIIPKRRKMNKTPNFSMSVTKPGFTLVEILVVIVVIGLLFMVFVPRIDFASNSARETGVKSDFRSFEFAAEQLMRENAGVSKHNTLATLCAASGGINQYLDAALQFDTTGKCAQTDPWNQNYTLQIVTPTGTGTNPNSGAIMFLSGGKDSKLDGTGDFAIATVFDDGKISSATSGFSSNITSASIGGITSNTAASVSIAGGVATLKYKK